MCIGACNEGMKRNGNELEIIYCKEISGTHHMYIILLLWVIICHYDVLIFLSTWKDGEYRGEQQQQSSHTATTLPFKISKGDYRISTQVENNRRFLEDGVIKLALLMF